MKKCCSYIRLIISDYSSLLYDSYEDYIKCNLGYNMHEFVLSSVSILKKAHYISSSAMLRVQKQIK